MIIAYSNSYKYREQSLLSMNFDYQVTAFKWVLFWGSILLLTPCTLVGWHCTLWRQPHIFPKRPKWPTSVKFSLLCQTTQGYLEQPETISYLTFFIRLCVRNMLKLLQIWSKPIKCNKEYFSSLVPNIFSNPPLPFRQI